MGVERTKMMMPKNVRTTGSNGFIPDRLLSEMPANEKQHAFDVCNRPDTSVIYVEDTDQGKLFAYAVIGPADNGALTIYAANTCAPMVTKMALKAMLGASSVLGKPLRVHSEKVEAMARFMGANDFSMAMDADGVNMGYFHG